MSMSRKFYVKLAAKYRAMKPTGEHPEALAMWAWMVVATANVIMNEASGFNTDKFQTAAGLHEEDVREPAGT